MRLLNTSTRKDEVTFQDVKRFLNPDAAGWTKVRAFCEYARGLDYSWAWVDTCCIDKRSSAELSEAINSMYKWYERAEICIVYLCDVTYTPVDVQSSGERQSQQPYTLYGRRVPRAQLSPATEASLRRSTWFRRGWTLQELIANPQVLFLDARWTAFGGKSSMSALLSNITGIENLGELRLGVESVATKMSWASRRVCTRSEDQAYSLMGIFGVNMPLLYGEGAEKAFLRLQLEILKSWDDESIFAWFPAEKSDSSYPYMRGMLADAPSMFQFSSQVRPFRPLVPRATYAMTNKGLEIETVLLRAKSGAPWSAFMPLNCVRKGDTIPMAVRLLKSATVYWRCSDYETSSLKWPAEDELKQQSQYSFHKIIILPDESSVGYTMDYNDLLDRHSPQVMWSLRGALAKYLPPELHAAG